MFDGPSVVHALARCGVTHVVWIPDSELGTWETALVTSSAIRLIRVSREGEAVAVASGLLIGGMKPVVAIQCTGLFEAGDALRNAVHDLNLPLFLIVGVRSLKAYRQQATVDTCPIFAEPIMKVWKIPYRLLDDSNSVDDLVTAYEESRDTAKAGAVLIAE